MNPRYLPLLAFAALTLGLWAAMTFSPPEPVRVATAMPALPLRALDGDRVEPEWRPAAGKVTLINFFASWCAPCLAEHPQLKNLSEIPGIELQGIAWNDKPEALQAWLAKHGNPFHQVWRDTTGRAAIAIGLRGVPESYVIDKQGKVRLHIQGAIGPAMEERLRELLIELRDAEVADAPTA